MKVSIYSLMTSLATLAICPDHHSAMIVPDAEYPFYPDRSAPAVFIHVRPLDAPIALASKAVFA